MEPLRRPGRRPAADTVPGMQIAVPALALPVLALVGCRVGRGAEQIFTNPGHPLTRGYITGRFG